MHMPFVSFYKMSGSGNDFIIIDNRTKIVDETDLSLFVRNVCHRRRSLGADGVILIEESDSADFRWRFYNNDGAEADMCGNGARCAARFAYENRIAGPRLTFETKAGIVSADVRERRVRVSMPDPRDIRHDIVLEICGIPVSVSAVHTGVPHAVILTDDAGLIPVTELGRRIRYHAAFAPDGVNVNFVSQDQNGVIYNRTYERGVEEETLACGTGCIACAVIMADRRLADPPVTVGTKGGEALTIHFRQTRGQYHDVFLEGDTRIICRGELSEEAWK
jgi:diaminopimelate epimerase